MKNHFLASHFDLLASFWFERQCCGYVACQWADIQYAKLRPGNQHTWSPINRANAKWLERKLKQADEDSWDIPRRSSMRYGFFTMAASLLSGSVSQLMRGKTWADKYNPCWQLIISVNLCVTGCRSDSEL